MQDQENNTKPTASTRTSDMHARIADALTKLSTCTRTISQYGRAHPLVEEMVRTTLHAISELLVVQPTVRVACTDTCFALDSFPIDDGAGCLAAFADSLHKRGVCAVILKTGVTHAELIEFAEAMSFSLESLTLRGGLEAEIARREIKHIVAKYGTKPTESHGRTDPADTYEAALLLVEEAMRAVESGLRIPVPEIRSVVADSLQSLMKDDSALLAFTGIRSYDRYLSEHSVNVCILSMVLGKDLGLDAASTLELGVSAMLHDIGKVFIPAEIVKKPGKLTEEEWQQIKRHPAEGARVLAGLTDLPALASTIALEHHMRIDGTGYPSPPGHYQPHLLSRLVAIVDTYDALTTDRPYREQWTGRQAIAWMLYEGWKHYDRLLLARFAAHANLYPLGSLVRLKCGDYAVVVKGTNAHPRAPIIRIIENTGSHAVGSREVDLSTNDDPELEVDCLAQPVEVLLPYADWLAA